MPQLVNKAMLFYKMQKCEKVAFKDYKIDSDYGMNAPELIMEDITCIMKDIEYGIKDSENVTEKLNHIIKHFDSIMYNRQFIMIQN